VSLFYLLYLFIYLIYLSILSILSPSPIGDGEIDEDRGLFYLVTYLFGHAWSYLWHEGSLIFLAA